MSGNKKSNGKYLCIDCGEELKDFNYKPITINPDDQKFSDNSHDLFHKLNENRRFFCHHCNCGYDEGEVLLGSGKAVSKMNNHDKFITYLENLKEDQKAITKLYINKQDCNGAMMSIGKINGYNEALSIFKRIEGGKL